MSHPAIGRDQVTWLDGVIRGGGRARVVRRVASLYSGSITAATPCALPTALATAASSAQLAHRSACRQQPRRHHPHGPPARLVHGLPQGAPPSRLRCGIRTIRRAYTFFHTRSRAACLGSALWGAQLLHFPQGPRQLCPIRVPVDTRAPALAADHLFWRARSPQPGQRPLSLRGRGPAPSSDPCPTSPPPL